MTNICQLDNRRLFLRIGTYQGVTRGEIKEPRACSTHLVGWTRARDDGAQGGLAAIVALPSVYHVLALRFSYGWLFELARPQQRDLRALRAIFDLVVTIGSRNSGNIATDCSTMWIFPVTHHYAGSIHRGHLDPAGYRGWKWPKRWGPNMKNIRSTSRRPELLLDLIALDRNSPEPLHRQLYLRLVELIIDGSLPLDGRLPSSRAFAQKINVSRNTVVSAYQQLEVEGWCSGPARVPDFCRRRAQSIDNAANRGTGRNKRSIVHARTADDVPADEFLRSGAPAFASTGTC